MADALNLADYAGPEYHRWPTIDQASSQGLTLSR